MLDVEFSIKITLKVKEYFPLITKSNPLSFGKGRG
jgi:hypothetical protein